MPTICKIELDAEEYRRTLEKVVAETRAAQAKLSHVQTVTVGSTGQSVAPVPSVGAAEAKISTEVSGEEEVEKLATAVASLPEKKRVEVEAKVKKTEQVQRLGKDLKTLPATASVTGQALDQVKGKFFGVGEGIKRVGEGLASAFSPATLALTAIMALLSAVAAACVLLWDRMTVSAAEYAAKLRDATEEKKKLREKFEEAAASAGKYLDRLRELTAEEGNSGKAETAELLKILRARYGDLGAEVDKTTGKLRNFEEIQRKVRSQDNAGWIKQGKKEKDALREEAKALYLNFQGSGSRYGSRLAGMMYDLNLRNSGGNALPKQLAYLRAQKKAATTEEDKAEWDKLIGLKEQEWELEKKISRTRKSGYRTAEEEQAARLIKARKADQLDFLRLSVEAEKRVQSERRADADYSDIRDTDGSDGTAAGDAKARAAADEKRIANRQALIDAEMKKADGLRKRMGEVSSGVSLAGEDDLEKESEFLSLEKDLLASREKIAGWEKQIADVRAASAEQFHAETLAAAQMVEEAEDELRLQNLLAAGKREEYEREKLLIGLKRQKKQLTDQEQQSLLSAQAGQRAAGLWQGVKDEAYALHGKAMEQTGHASEFARTDALRRATERKGGKLTDAESDTVSKLAALTSELSALGTAPAFSTGTRMSNDLTARGGFSGGAQRDDASAWLAKQTAHLQKSAGLLEKIEKLNEKIETELTKSLKT